MWHLPPSALQPLRENEGFGHAVAGLLGLEDSMLPTEG